MQHLLPRLGVVIIALTTIASGVATAGEACSECCKKSCRPSCALSCLLHHRCCLTPGEPPRGEVAFSIPGVVRDGRAVRVSEDSMERAIRRQAAADFRKEAADDCESAEVNGCETRLEQLESDLKELDQRIDRITIALEVIARKQR